MSITSANAIFTLTVNSLYPVPQTLQKFAVDDAFNIDALAVAQTRMGIDGKMSYGYTPEISVMNISFQADSPSVSIFDFILQSTKVTKDTYELSGTISLPGLGKSYTLTNGVLVSAKQMPDAKKVLEQQTFVLHWEAIYPALI